MSLAVDEQILVIPTQRFHEIGYFQGFSPTVSRPWELLLAGQDARYLPRSVMETDPAFKQLIPYVIFRYRAEDGEIRLFHYRRGQGQGEARLRSKLSIGVGGHISQVDHRDSSHETYYQGMQRELDEEVTIDTPYEATLVGMINDDLTEVGRVHLGIVHCFDVEQESVHPREAAMVDARFASIHELRERLQEMESWSQICMDALFGAV